MGITDTYYQYKEFKNGVKHCTFNPKAPGVVRVHLIPPKYRLFKSTSYIVILNGYYILPIGSSWALMLSYFMDEVNKYGGRPIDENDEDMIISSTVKKVSKIYPSMRRSDIEDDLFEMMRILFAVARGDDPEVYLEKLSIRSYAKNMTAPHRMDLMVSAMTDSHGKWSCNQKCLFCYAAGQKMSSAKELSTEEWEKIIEKLWRLNVPMLTFTGGEPTMRNDIDTLISYAKKFVTRLNTNGALLTESLVERLKEAELDSVQITLYSHDEKIHNSLVGAERFNDTVNGIKNAVKAGLDVSINTPLCKKNSDYVKTLEFIRSLGVRFVTSSGLICTGNARINSAEYDMTEDELFEAVAEAKSFCDENEMEIDFTSPGLIAEKRLESIGMRAPICGASLSNMAIAPDGTVVPCQSWLGEDSSLGNILTDNFKNIWNHKLCLKLRKMTDEEAAVCPFRAKTEGK